MAGRLHDHVAARPGDHHRGRLFKLVEDVFDTGEFETVYNVRVADFHTYFVGSQEWGFSIWAHNAEYTVRPGENGNWEVVNSQGEVKRSLPTKAEAQAKAAEWNEQAAKQWPPSAPQGPKPEFGQPGAAEWRYQRYVYEQFEKGKATEDILSFSEWRSRHFDVAESGGRPGRPGGPEQVAARKALEAKGFRNVENVELGGQFPDMVKANGLGGTDYVEVGKMLEDGRPEARERAKLVNEVRALKANDRLIFVDKTDITNIIMYKPGDAVK